MSKTYHNEVVCGSCTARIYSRSVTCRLLIILGSRLRGFSRYGLKFRDLLSICDCHFFSPKRDGNHRNGSRQRCNPMIEFAPDAVGRPYLGSLRWVENLTSKLGVQSGGYGTLLPRRRYKLGNAPVQFATCLRAAGKPETAFWPVNFLKVAKHPVRLRPGLSETNALPNAAHR